MLKKNSLKKGVFTWLAMQVRQPTTSSCVGWVCETYILDVSVNLLHALLALLSGPGEQLESLLVVFGEVFTHGLLRVDLDVVSMKFNLVNL